MPARMRASTYSASGSRATTDSMPSAASRWDSSRPAGPAPMMATWVRMPPVNARRRRPAQARLSLSGSARPGCGRCPAPRPAARRPAAAGRACRSAHDDAERGDDPSPAPRDRHGDRARAQAHLLARSARSPSRAHPAQLLAQPAGLGDRVRRDPGQVGQHRGLHLVRRVREQHLADPGRVQRQPRADPADHRHRRVPGQPVDVERLACRRATARCTVASVAPYRSCRNGDATWRSPACTGASRPRSHSRRPTTYSPVGRPGQRAPPTQLADQPVRGRQRQAGPPASSVSVSARCVGVEGAEQGQQRATVTDAPGVPVLPAIARPSAERKPSLAPVGRAPSVDGRRQHRRVTGRRVDQRRRARTRPRSAPRSPSRRRTSGGGAEPQPLLDYPPYRSSVLRHPTKDPAAGRPRGRRAGGAGLRARRTSTPLEADLTIQHRGEPLGERMVVTGRVLDGDGRPVRHQLVEIWQANAGRPLHATSATSTRRRSTRTSPAPGRCLTDADGTYRFVTDQARALPVAQPPATPGGRRTSTSRCSAPTSPSG